MSTWERLVLSIPGHGISYEICNEHEIKKGWGLNLHCLLQRSLRSATGTTYHGALRIHEFRDFLKFRFLPSCCSHRQCIVWIWIFVDMGSPIKSRFTLLNWPSCNYSVPVATRNIKLSLGVLKESFSMARR